MAYYGDNAIHAWADIDGTGTPHLDNNYNCTSVTDHGTGDYTVNFSTNASNAHYCVLASNIGETNDDHTHSFICSKGTGHSGPATSGCRFAVEHKSAGSRDQDHLNFLVIAEYA